MQTCEKGTYFAEYICLVRQENVVIGLGYLNDMGRGYAGLKGFGHPIDARYVQCHSRCALSRSIERVWFWLARIGKNRQNRRPNLCIFLFTRPDRGGNSGVIAGLANAAIRPNI